MSASSRDLTRDFGCVRGGLATYTQVAPYQYDNASVSPPEAMCIKVVRRRALFLPLPGRVAARRAA